MSRISEPSIPLLPPALSIFRASLGDYLRKIAAQLNNLTEGKIAAVTNATTAAPTAGTYNQGDKIWHSAPVEAGSVSSKYVIIGYVCVAAGTPGTWREMRVLTGN